MKPFKTFQSQDHLTRHSLDKQENKGHREQQLRCSAGLENAGQFVKVFEKDSVLRSREREWMRVLHKIALIKD